MARQEVEGRHGQQFKRAINEQPRLLQLVLGPASQTFKDKSKRPNPKAGLLWRWRRPHSSATLLAWAADPPSRQQLRSPGSQSSLPCQRPSPLRQVLTSSTQRESACGSLLPPPLGAPNTVQ